MVRHSKWIGLSGVVLAGLIAPHSTTAQAPADATRGTRVIITAARAGHTPLGDQIADSLAVLLRRRFRCTELEVLTWRDADRLLLVEPLPDTVSVEDLREFAKGMAADVILDLRVDTRGPGNVYLAPMVIDQRTAAIHALASMHQPNSHRTPQSLATQIASDTLFRRRYPLRSTDRAARQLTCAAPVKRAMEAAPAALHFMNSLAGELGR
jgi:hypothetical protein